MNSNPPFAPSSKSRLTAHDLGRFTGNTLSDRIARSVCRAGCLPRKEFFEAWQVARRVRRRFRGGRVVDLAGGHGLLAHVMLLLDDTSPEAIVVDTHLPPSHLTLHAQLLGDWPRLDGRVRFVSGRMSDIALTRDDVVVASHACGQLTDSVLERAMLATARVAVLPCCHDVAVSTVGPLSGWLDDGLAIDVMRAVRLEHQGYRVWTQTISHAVTPKNRLLMADPPRRSGA